MVFIVGVPRQRKWNFGLEKFAIIAAENPDRIDFIGA
jgi:hypothetical protein